MGAGGRLVAKAVILLAVSGSMRPRGTKRTLRVPVERALGSMGGVSLVNLAQMAEQRMAVNVR